jgi:hypothetical protein
MVGRRSGILKSIFRRYAPSQRARGHVLKKLAKRLGLVYFGDVDQHEDEHEVIRGLTVSTTHRDAHYSVGTYDGYDLSMVDRFDILISPEGKVSEHSWLIYQIDLENERDLPHIFLMPRGLPDGHFSKLFHAAQRLHPINLMLEGHTDEFHSRYELLAASTHLMRLETVFTQHLTQSLAVGFWPHALEILDGKLYVYITNQKLTESMLAAALQSALWLARHLDGEDANQD